jgi:hypothetical protein
LAASDRLGVWVGREQGDRGFEGLGRTVFETRRLHGGMAWNEEQGLGQIPLARATTAQSREIITS